MKKYYYFVSYMTQGNNNQVVGYCNAEICRTAKILFHEDVEKIEEALKKDLKEKGRNTDKVVVTNFILVRTENVKEK